MIRKSHQSTLVKGWNLLSRIGPRHIMAPHLTVEQIMTDAVHTAGVSDFGELHFIEPLDRLISSMENSAALHSFGRFFVKKMLAGQLVHRLKLIACLKENPEIHQQRIRSPLIILGMPRTGSTFLFNLLAQNPSHRYVRNWEAVVSQVPPSGTYDLKNDPRRKLGKRLLNFQNYLAPGLKTMHEFSLDGPEECTPLLMQSFMVTAYGAMFHAPEYLKWLATASRINMYQHHKNILQTLQWKYPSSRWVLKSPLHSDALEELLTVYPDACLIHTHRDPVKAVSSYASLSAAFRGITTPEIDSDELGQQTLELLAESKERFDTQRKRIASDRILDIPFNGLVKDPLGTVKKIHQHFELGWSEETQEKTKTFLARDREVKRVHQYEARDYGLTSEKIRKRLQVNKVQHTTDVEMARSNKRTAHA